MDRRTLYVFVTNDLNQDQRMHKICDSLTDFGYEVSLIGRKKSNSKPLSAKKFTQIRLDTFFEKGVFFYLEYNLRIFWFILTGRKAMLYSVDLDTLLSVRWGAFFRFQNFVFDAHEWFSETPELENKPWKKRVWEWVAKSCIPKAKNAITVNESLAEKFEKLYQTRFTAIYNVPILNENTKQSIQIANPFTLIYQGVLNEGRGLEEIIDAMDLLSDVELIIVGEGDLSESLRQKAVLSNASGRIRFTGWLFGNDLKDVTLQAHVGLNLLDSVSKNYYYSLANKFFDYMHAGVPSVNMNFPEYYKIIQRFEVGLLVNNLDPKHLAETILNLKNNPDLYQKIKKNALEAKYHYHWEMEKIKLRKIFSV